MLRTFQHRNSPGISAGAKNQKMIKHGGNPESATITDAGPNTAMLLHQLVVKLCYLPVSLQQTLASIVSKALNMRIFPL
jgi:hypothetical protein